MILPDDAVLAARATLLVDKATKYMPQLSDDALDQTFYLQAPITFAVRDYVELVVTGRNAMPMVTALSTLIVGNLRAAYALGHEQGYRQAMNMKAAGFGVEEE